MGKGISASQLLWTVGYLALAIIICMVVMAWIRKRYMDVEKKTEGTFTLSRLRALKKNNDLTEKEYDLLRQNILYAEMFFSPSRFSEQGLTTKGLAEAIRSGFKKVPGVEIWLIADLVRDHGPVRAEQTLEEAAEAKEFGIVGIGMGGSEHLYPPKPFTKVYEEARQMGFKTSVHAGEAAGSESVWGALLDLGVDRIGHATRAEEDASLLEHLQKEATPLELCPLSNVATGVIPSYQEHPVRRYWEQGLKLTINTDDPGMFHNHLSDEYIGLMDHFNFTPEDIQQFILNALESSWRPGTDSEKSLAKQFQAHPNWTPPGLD